MLSHIVLFQGFFLRRRQGDRLVHPLHGKRHCVAEQSADPRCHIDSGTSQFLQGNDFQADYPAAAFLPNRSNPQEVKELGNALTPAAHIGAAPQNYADAFRIVAFFGNKPFNQKIGQLLAAFPSDRRRQHARVHAVKIAPGRQNVGYAAGRRARRARLDKLSAKRRQRIVDFLACQRQVSLQRSAQVLQYLMKSRHIFCCGVLQPGSLGLHDRPNRGKIEFRRL